MKIIILGGGLAGLSLAHFYHGSSLILEKEKIPGGLCRSFLFQGVYHDIGPHIIFSRNEKMLHILTSLTETNQLRRSNQIFHKGQFVKYPFENDLSALPSHERDYCLTEFLSNPYESYPSDNMLQFFLKTFGEGITRLYLQPYNEKIWKFDPSFMDIQMVERIPKPPKEDVIKSAKGEPTEGYTHQLFFHYPKSGGIQSLIHGLIQQIQNKTKIIPNIAIHKIEQKENQWQVYTDQGTFSGDQLVNCMPIHELVKYLPQLPQSLLQTVNALQYNSIYIVLIYVKKEMIGNHFAIYIADQTILFHRLSRLNFLGASYCAPNGGTILQAEITYRSGSYLSQISQDSIMKQIADQLNQLGLIDKNDICDMTIKQYEYAYVIYDLNHRKHVDYILDELSNRGIQSCGRFAEFEYLNMDQTIEHSYHLANQLNTIIK